MTDTDASTEAATGSPALFTTGDVVSVFRKLTSEYETGNITLEQMLRACAALADVATRIREDAEAVFTPAPAEPVEPFTDADKAAAIPVPVFADPAAANSGPSPSAAPPATEADGGAPNTGGQSGEPSTGNQPDTGTSSAE